MKATRVPGGRATSGTARVSARRSPLVAESVDEVEWGVREDLEGGDLAGNAWHGAHTSHLYDVVERALRVVFFTIPGILYFM